LTRISFHDLLAGGDRRSIGNSNRVAGLVLKNPDRFLELMDCLLGSDPVVRMRAADAAEKVSVKQPAILARFKRELLDLAEQTTQAEVRWHLALMIPRLALGRGEKDRAMVAMRRFLNDRSSIVKTFALQALADMSRGDRDLETDVLVLLERAASSGTAAMKARSRKLLAQFAAK